MSSRDTYAQGAAPGGAPRGEREDGDGDAALCRHGPRPNRPGRPASVARPSSCSASLLPYNRGHAHHASCPHRDGGNEARARRARAGARAAALAAAARQPHLLLARSFRTARRAAPPGSDRPRADLRQVRADAVDPPRSPTAGHRRRARQAPGSRAAVPVGAGGCDADAHLRQAARPGLPRVRRHASGERVDRAGAFRRAARRHPGGGEGAAARHRPRDRARPRADADGGVAGGPPVEGRQAPEAARGGGRIRQDDSRRARSHARGRQLLAAPPQLQAFAADAGAGHPLGLDLQRSAGDGADGGHPHRPHRGADARGH